MAWPFSNVVAPNFDSGAGGAVPTSTTAVTATTSWLLGAHFTNSGSVQRTVTLTNTAGNTLSIVTIPAGGEMPYEWPFRPAVGVKWIADGAGVVGHIWGYQ